MPSVLKRGGTWYIKIRRLDGKWERRRTSATTRDAALELALRLDGRRERVREGLAEPEPSELTLGELVTWWLKHKCPVRSRERETSRLRKWVHDNPAVADLRGPSLNGPALERWFIRLEGKGVSGSLLNHLRASLRTTFNRATRAGYWTGPNPMAMVERRPEEPKEYDPLRVEEVPAFLAQVPVKWRDLFAAAICTGLRKGELFGMRRETVDLKRMALVVRHSYDHPTSKGGHVDGIPIPDVLLPHLRHALEVSKSAELVFPGFDGNMQDGDDAKLALVVQRALRKAGMVRGWRHTCRRCKSRGLMHEEEALDDAPRRCPICKMQLWPKAIPRRLTFHGLRHTSATVLLRSGVDLARVQRILRHKDPKLTASQYGHLIVEDLRTSINLPWGVLPELPPAPEPVVIADAVGTTASEPEAFGPPVVQPEISGGGRVATPHEITTSPVAK